METAVILSTVYALQTLSSPSQKEGVAQLTIFPCNWYNRFVNHNGGTKDKLMTVSSIFNDVIGPVMRGPSSSHSAAGCRLGLLLRDLLEHGVELVEHGLAEARRQVARLHRDLRAN